MTMQKNFLFLLVALVFGACNLKEIDPIIVDPIEGVSFDVSFGPNCPCVPCEVAFTNTSSGGATFSWTFGDGESSAEENPTHTFDAAGVFNVKLTVDNGVEMKDTTAIIEIATPSTFSQTVGTIGIEYAYALTLLDDGGYVVVGEGDDKIYFARLNSDGNVLIERALSTSFSGINEVSAAILTSNGRIAITGSAYNAVNSDSGSDIFLVQTNLDGDILDSDLYNDNSSTFTSDIGYDLKETSDEGFIIAGSWDSDALLLKTDKNGNQENTYLSVNESTEGALHSVLVTSGNRYLVSGYNDDGSTTSIFVARTTTSGFATWREEVGVTTYTYRSKVMLDDGDNFFVTYTELLPGDTAYNVAVARFTSSQTLDWKKTYPVGASGVAELMLGSAPTPDQGVICTGVRLNGNIFNFDWDLFLVKIDEEGTLEWRKNYGLPGLGNGEYGTSVAPTQDCGLITSGVTNTEGAGDFDFWILKTDLEGNL